MASNRKMCAAGVPTISNRGMQEAFESYSMQDEVDSLINSAIKQPHKQHTTPLAQPKERDQRNTGTNSNLCDLVNPPPKTKFQAIAEELNSTTFKSYWKKVLGKSPDPVPMFPEGFDIMNTTYGKPLDRRDPLYEIILPKQPQPDKTPKSKLPGVQKDRGYCSPFDPDLAYGVQYKTDKRGIFAKCVLTDHEVEDGTSDYCALNLIQVERKKKFQRLLGRGFDRIGDIACVPDVNIVEKMTGDNSDEYMRSNILPNPKRNQVFKSMGHLNTVRKILMKRYYPPNFRDIIQALKYQDKQRSGWIPKESVYSYLQSIYIRVEPELMEPLLSAWNAFDGSNIHYETLVNVLDFRQPLPDLPRLTNSQDYTTTYREMVKPCQEVDERKMAGVPTGRYFDMDYPVVPKGCCKAHLSSLMEESDARSVISPSTLSSMNVSHRDMYATRDPAVVRRVFEAAGNQFTDETFNNVWEEAKKYHSKGIVCYETFRRALEKFES